MNLFVLSNLRSKTTGIKGAVIWVAGGEFGDGNADLGPRLLVVPGDDIAADRLKGAVTVRLTDPPQVVGMLPPHVDGRVASFVARNRVVLLSHWTGALSTREMLDALERQR